ncbi:hypothetical protein H0H92_000034 [Tricholoma furcatifolium]|nr:hypothetical protein H0H92_000034 [Tricholoma furcatifolium]
MVTSQVHIPDLQPRCQISTRGWSLKDILENNKNFQPVPRYSLTDATQAIQAFEADGIPLIIQGLHEESKWLKKEFEPDWLLEHGQKEINVRNVHNWADKRIPSSEFIENCRAAPELTTIRLAIEQERLYGKDAECPQMWNDWLHESQVVPPYLTPNHVDNLLLSYHVETLMCYLGIGDTFTPCHKDLCASSGQNLMCYTEKNGSSFWFMTKEADAPEASKYFQQLNQELDHETHVMTIEQLADAPFDVYVAEQKLGDLVLVPPRSCHQVVNYGGLTIKTSWSRMTLKGLETAYYHELPIYRRSTIYLALTKKRDELVKVTRRNIATTTECKKLISATQTLLRLFEWILLEESPPKRGKIRCLDPPSADSYISDVNDLTCDFCGADIFQSYFECLLCVSFPPAKSGDGFIICPGCYIDGRACSCGKMEPMQRHSFEELAALHEEVANMLAGSSKPTKLNSKFSEKLLGVRSCSCVGYLEWEFLQQDVIYKNCAKILPRGTEPDIAQQRAHLAEQYQTCKPINSKFMQGGWYDVHIQVPTTEPHENDSQESAVFPETSPRTILSAPSPLTELTSVATPHDILSETEALETSLKRKRLVFDGVEAISQSKLPRN